MVVGFHFYKEGTNKLQYGFSSWGFLSAAKGPFADLFKQMLDDPDGTERLCIQTEKDSVSGEEKVTVDPEFTFMIWNEFLDEATSYYGFGSTELQAELKKRRKELADDISVARDEQDKSVDTFELELLRAKYENDILKLRNQRERLEEIFKEHKAQLNDWIDLNRVELIAHFSTSDRLEGFDRDGENKEVAAIYVDSLRDQVQTIAKDRNAKLRGWTAEVTGIWDSLESQVNDLAVDDQIGDRDSYTMFRHFDQDNSFVKMIDRIIPWFDTIIGVLLILGLFTRLASLAAAIFLISVIMTQPPWIPGTAPTYFYAIELMALLVIFATCAG
ncbi:MAG: hypothetical protein AAF939_22880, partial [Planctomycetota bacterium]